MRYKRYLSANFSDKLISDAVKIAYKNKDIDSNRHKRAIGYAGISALGNSLVNHNLPLPILGSVAGVAAGLGLGLSALRSHDIKINTKRAIKNAVRSGLITNKELNNYVNRGKLTPNLAITLNKANI